MTAQFAVWTASSIPGNQLSMVENKEISCPFTGATSVWDRVGGYPGVYGIESPVCGRYGIEQKALDWLKVAKLPQQGLINCARRIFLLRKPGEMTVWVQRSQYKQAVAAYGKDPSLVWCAIEDALEEPIDHAEKPQALLSRFAEKLARTGAYAAFHAAPEDMVWARIAGQSEMRTILKFLHDRGSLDFLQTMGPDVFSQSLTMKVLGWEQVRQRNQGVLSNKVFIATKFEWPGEEKLWAEVMQMIRDACKACGYDADFVSQGHTGYITDHIIAEIRRSRFVVAELTYNNRGVYFEAGLARGYDQPVFHVVRDSHVDGKDEEGKKLHFDVQQVRYQKWSDTNLPKLKQDLEDWIISSVGRYSR